jgi:hypothetical protein
MTLNLGPPLSIGGNNGLTIAQLALDAQGNQYITGAFTGDVNFDPNPNDAPHTLHAGATANAFVASYSPSNGLLWVKQFQAGGTDVSDGLGLVVDPASGTSYVVGVLSGTVNFDPGGTNVTRSAPNTTGGFVVKLTSSGAIDPSAAPALFSAGANPAILSGVALDPSGPNVYITGRFVGTGTYAANPGSALTDSAGGSAADAFLLKLTTNLGYVWGQTGGVANSFSTRVAVDSSSHNVLVAGTETIPGGKAATAFVEKFSPTGTLLGKDQFGGQFSPIPSANNVVLVALATDSSGNVYLGGEYAGNVLLNFGTVVPLENSGGPLVSSSGFDTFLIKFDPSLNVTWARSFGAPTTNELLNGLAIDGSNNVYLDGQLGAPSTFGPTLSSGTAVADPNPAGQYAAYILEVDSNGNLLDSAVASSPAGAAAVPSVMTAVAAGPSGAIAVAGSIGGATNLSNVTVSLPAGAANGVFLASLTATHSTPAGGSGGSGGAPPPVVAPKFVNETRVLVSSGKKRSPKQTLYQLNFDGPLNVSQVKNAGLYHVTQTRNGRGKNARPASLSVAVLSASASASGTSVLLRLGTFTKNLPMTLTASGLTGANGSSVAPVTTTL